MSSDSDEGPARQRVHRLYYVAAGGGAALWLLTVAASGRGEAWDSPLYWKLTYPLCIAFAAWLGWRGPERPWRWALAVMLAQPFMLLLTGGGSFGLLPLGLLLFAVLSLPLVLAANIAARVRRKRTDGTAAGG